MAIWVFFFPSKSDKFAPFSPWKILYIAQIHSCREIWPKCASKKNSLVSLDQMEGLVNYILRPNGCIKMVASDGSIEMAFT